MSNENTLKRVVDCLAAATRYPTQLLSPDADLENDLGIDSVKRVEIAIALSEEFGVDLQSNPPDPSTHTIRGLGSWIDELMAAGDAEQHDRQVFDRQTPPSESHVAPRISHVSRPESLRTPHFAVQESNGQAASAAQPLRGRVALVTGSGRGVGRSIARFLAARGATVVVNSFHSRDQGEETVAEITAQGGQAVHIWGSVANPEHVDSIFNEIEQSLGLDILVCNASDGRIGPFLELTSDDWDRAFRTNVSGHYNCAIRAAQLMRPRGGGAIVTMSAVGAHQYIAGLGSQGVVKAGVESLTRYLACELGRFGIRVNCVAGGPVYGELLDKFPAAQVAQNHWESIVPDGELCTSLDLAEAVGFLVSDAARGINGAVWMVDHGFSANADGQSLRRLTGEAILDSSR